MAPMTKKKKARNKRHQQKRRSNRPVADPYALAGRQAAHEAGRRAGREFLLRAAATATGRYIGDHSTKIVHAVEHAWNVLVHH